nr:PREDICTED: unconventional myosin-IXa [Latimeria chalumnae]|eukprot:XP_014346729.1 PREDICTED: unconventional myosin-IXa [Latimeria chalumnae]
MLLMCCTAFGNAKTAHNNNSSRFGKFIQVNYQETGTVRGAYVEKYLLEKSRLVYQEHNERNYHVFYYLLAGASEEERTAFHLKEPEEYHYLNQMTKKPLRPSWDEFTHYYESEPDCFTVEGEDLKHDFERLQLAMEMVGFLPITRRQIFSLLSAILHLGNIRYKKKTYRDDSIDICNPEVLPIVSDLLEVKEEMLFEALTTRKTVTVGERLIVPYRLAEAVTVRDSMAKSLYSALFDWIVFRINHALLNTRDLEENTKILSIGVLDIFGFEDYESNSFEQFCINFANERLQHYFNQHIFKLEQEEYRAEGISWYNIEYIDNTGCINLISKKPTGLLHLLDEECNFPQATNQTLLDKFKRQHEGNSYIEFPAVMEPAFIIKHYAGKVKYGVKDFREKNTDHMRPDIVALLRSSRNAFICGLIGIDPVAVFRWAVLRAFFRGMVAFREAGKRFVEKKTGHDDAVPCAVLKSVDSFSFLHHPVHQRSLEILQRCKEEKYSITRKSPRTPLSDLQGANTINEKTPRENFGMSWNGRTGVRQSRLSTNSSLLEEDGIFVNSTSSKLLERAHGILMRNKNYKVKPSLPKHLLDVKSLKYFASLTLHDRITKSLLHLHKKKKPPSISAQFQASLNKLMETLGQAEPYFVKCIRSNAEKLSLRFNDNLVLRQLRYTGMLETVRIRQSGYSIKYTFQDFVDHFHVLLPWDTLPSKWNIQDFLKAAELDPNNYQIGKTMVFMKERERQQLQDLLHKEVLRRITLLQHWVRAFLERRHFMNLKQAATIIQKCWRSYKVRQDAEEEQAQALIMNSAATSIQSAWRGYWQRKRFLQMREAAFVIQSCWREYQQRREEAAMLVQAAWRGYQDRKAYWAQKDSIILLQTLWRGFSARQRFRALKEQKLKEGQLSNGLDVKPENLNVENEDFTIVDSSDPTKWEDGSFDERERAIRERRSVEELNKANVGWKDTPTNLQSSSDERGTNKEVVVRERPKSLEDPDQKKVFRAKRESRRMRELEQEKFSLELLKVRSTGGSTTPPTEEHRWSTELVTEGLHSPQGTPDSESSRGSFEVLACEDNQKLKLSSTGGEDEAGGPLAAPELQDSFLSNPKLDPLSLFSSSLDINCIVPSGPSILASSGFTSSPPAIERPADDNLSTGPRVTVKLPFTSSTLQTFYMPRLDNIAKSAQPAGDVLALGPLSTEDTGTNKEAVTTDRSDVSASPSQDFIAESKSKVPLADSQTASEKTDSKLEESPMAGVEGDTKISILEHREKQKAEQQRSAQRQNEKEMMEQIRQQKEILKLQRQLFEQDERNLFEKHREEALQRIEQCRHNDSRQADRPQSLLILHTQDAGDPADLSPTAVELQLISGPDASSTERNPSTAKDRPVSLFLDRREWPALSLPETTKIDGWSPKLTRESRDSPATAGTRNERPRQPRLQSQGADGLAGERATAIFFSPKDNKVTFNKVHKNLANQENTSVSVKDAPSEKAPKASISRRIETNKVPRPAHKKKARMARTRSDFLTRCSYAGGEGDTEEDDFDDIIEPPLSPKQSSHPSLEPALRLACYSDSEMMLQQLTTAEGLRKHHKTLSQGEIGKRDIQRKNSATDGRPLRGKMRFWGKGKQGEKKVSREKLATQVEIQELPTDQETQTMDTSPTLQTSEGADLGQRHLTPPRSPDLAADRGKEFKENKEPSPKVKRKRSVKISNIALEPAQWQNDSLQIISSAADFKSMNEFLQKKITDLDTEDSKKDTMVDVVFKKALKEFRMNIFNSYSTALALDDGKSIRYKDLYALFEQILEKTMRQEQRDWSESPVKVWVNTFKVFLDEFMTEYKAPDNTFGKITKTERKKRRKKDTDVGEEHNGHIFKSTQYSIPTYCEFCSSLIWMMERAYVCKLCKYACHKKCCLKTITKCSKKFDPELSSRQFGVELSRLTNDERSVPLVVEKLINYIEMHGLYTEGIYRKSGSTNKIKELRQGLDTDINCVNLDEYNIHVIASVFKQWLRDLPNPLMTFELYDEFLRAMGLQERKEVIRGVYSVIDQLSRTHLSTLERLIFHLVSISLQEETNRMSANALAIVFAPCILRCPDTTDPLLSVQDIGKTTSCVELIIIEQTNKYKARLKDINSLEFAENKAKSRLSLIRRSMGKGRLRRGNYPSPTSQVAVRLPSVSDVPEETTSAEESMELDLSEQQQVAMQQEERVLTEQIENLQKEKEELTYEMLALEPRASDDETLESEASIGTADSSETLNLDSEGAVSDRSERSFAAGLGRHPKPDSAIKVRRPLRKQPDSVDSTDSSISSLPSSSSLGVPQGHGRRFRFRSKSPLSGFYKDSTPEGDAASPGQIRGQEERSLFISRGTFNPEKGKQKLKTVKSPQKPRDPPDGAAGRKRNPDTDYNSSQQLVVYGSNEFMV